jgi:MGT family glycosyltransferase
MSRIAFLPHAATGHLNSAIAIAWRLRDRGHKIVFLQVEDMRQEIELCGFEFFAIGREKYPPGEIARLHAIQSSMTGLKGFRFTLEKLRRQSSMQLSEVYRVLAEHRADALVADQVLVSSASVATQLNVPLVTICSALPANAEPGIPPFTTSWTPSGALAQSLKNRLANGIFRLLIRSVVKTATHYNQQHKLPPVRSVEETWSRDLQIAQTPQGFDFPRKELPANFHYTGPFIEPAARRQIPFEMSRLNGKPLVYASLGTLQNRHAELFRNIAGACARLDVQLVITLGGRALPGMDDLPGDPIVLDFAPQLELLQHAALTVTHGGLNTTLESLSYGVPLVAVPITNDQPGVAARIKWHGLGEVVNLSQATVENLTQAIRSVLTVPSYRKRARDILATIRETDALDVTARLIEDLIARWPAALQ